MSVDVSKGNLLVEVGPSGVAVSRGNLLVLSGDSTIQIARGNFLLIAYPGLTGRRRQIVN